MAILFIYFPCKSAFNSVFLLHWIFLFSQLCYFLIFCALFLFVCVLRMFIWNWMPSLLLEFIFYWILSISLFLFIFVMISLFLFLKFLDFLFLLFAHIPLTPPVPEIFLFPSVTFSFSSSPVPWIPFSFNPFSYFLHLLV